MKFRFGSKDNNSCYDNDSDWNDPERLELKETNIEAPTLEDSLEHFCSTCTELESHIGRVVHENWEKQTVPRGLNMMGEKFDTKPSLDKTREIPDNQIIQVWQYDEKALHWFYGNKRKGDDRLVFELPLSEVWKYDRWSNVDHPALPAPDFGNIDSGFALSNPMTFKDRPIRTLSRAELSNIKRELTLKKQTLELTEQGLDNAIRKLSEELEFRGQQLKYLQMYLGRNIEIKIILKGPKAPESEIVNIRQRVLFMSEEVGAIEWNEVGFDFRNIEDFDKWVTKPENLAIIAPESRCIVFLKPRRSDADYGDPFTNFYLNRENRRVYALLKNGLTVYRAYVDIHVSDKLFPEAEQLEREIENRREGNIGSWWDSDWDWKKYADLWKARKPWYDKGYTDADFDETIEYKTKEEMLAAKAEAKARHEAREADPKTHVKVDSWDLSRVYEDYRDKLKQYFFGLAFIQGIFDRTDIFGYLQNKVNVFTGQGLDKYVKLIYDMAPERMLEDKDTPSLVSWLKSEANKVKVGDLVVVRGHVYRRGSDYPHSIKGIARVVYVKSKGVIKAYMERETWLDDPERGIRHKLRNSDGDGVDDLHFYPYNIPLDKLHFYIERRQDRDLYWDNLMVDLMRLKRQRLTGKEPQLGRVSHEERLNLWSRDE